MSLADEIAEQPLIAERLLRELPVDLDPLVHAARRAGVEYVLIAARGSSDHAAIYGQYVLGAVARRTVALATPSLFSRYATPPRLGRALVLGISQSGRSPDVVSVLSEARRQRAVTAAVTNAPASPLAQAAEHRLLLRSGDERSIAATKTYTAALLVMAQLAVALAGAPRRAVDALGKVPEAQRSALLGAAETAEAVAEAYRDMDDCVVLGRGFNLSTALEWALKLKELAYVPAQAYSTADFQHGPVASLPPGGHVLAVIARGPMAADLRTVIHWLRRERGARALVLSGSPLRGAAHLPFPDVLPEWLSPLVAMLPAQLAVAALARAKGLNVEQPRGLQKVTLTR